jgi:hypothetical protein
MDEKFSSLTKIRMDWKAADFKNTSTACFTAFFSRKKALKKREFFCGLLHGKIE